MNDVVGYGVCLTELQSCHIEMLREWRNDEALKPFMLYREYITPEMQQLWFQNISKRNDLYFIAGYNGKSIGVIHLSGINEQAQTAEAGLFMADFSILNTDVPVRISLLFLELIFGMFPDMQIEAKARTDNKKVWAYNAHLGFEKISEAEEVVHFILSKNRFITKTSALRKIVSDLYGNKKIVQCSGSEIGLLPRLLRNSEWSEKQIPFSF